MFKFDCLSDFSIKFEIMSRVKKQKINSNNSLLIIDSQLKESEEDNAYEPQFNEIIIDSQMKESEEDNEDESHFNETNNMALQSGINASNIIRENVLKEKTVINYEYKIDKFVKYCLHMNPTLKTTRTMKHNNKVKDCIKLPISLSLLHGFFGYIGTDPTLTNRKRSRNWTPNYTVQTTSDGKLKSNNEKTITPETMGLYKSSILYLYRIKNVKPEVITENGNRITIEEALTGRIEGYKKLIGEKKQNGIMESKEGKQNISIGGYNIICLYACRLQNHSSASFNVNEGL